MALAKTAKFAKLMIFLDDLAKTTKVTKLPTFRDGLAKTAKFGKLNIFTTTLRFIIHVFQLIVKRIVLLSKLHLRVNDFFREKTLHMICLKLGLKVTNFQGTGPWNWSKMQILTAVHLEIDSTRRKEIFSMQANLTLMNKTIVHW